MKTILLKFSGPLQSWGTSSNFETRGTDRYPSKSAVLGMIAGSCGYRRSEDEKVSRLNSLDFAVRIDQPGTLLRDYHIATKYNDKGKLLRTYVTNRYYLQDAVFVVAVGSSDCSLINHISDSLKSPYFQPYLGRRSLPLNSDFFLGTREAGVIDSIKELPWQASSWYQWKSRTKEMISLDIYADSHLLNTRNTHVKRDLVISFSSAKRHHSFRSVSKTEVNITLEHDAMKAIGG